MTNIVNGSDVMFTFDGKEPIRIEPIEIKINSEKAINDGDDLNFFNRAYSGTIKDIEISEEFMNMTLSTDRLYTVVGTGYKFPRGNKLPKKKRIRKKWMKKYVYDFELKDCAIV